jgi:dTDP-D-glucose 4,6-dehydratase
MKTVVQARLDEDSQVALNRLVRKLGWSPSQVVREGLRLMTAYYGEPAKKRIVGLGQFASGHSDLATNEKHMEGFGR